MREATDGERYRKQAAPQAGLGDALTDTAQPSGTDREDDFEALLHQLVIIHAPEPPGPRHPDAADWIQNRLWPWLGVEP